MDDISIGKAESLLFDFGTIRAATNEFSDSNKLGQGGFGAVYKVQRDKNISVFLSTFDFFHITCCSIFSG